MKNRLLLIHGRGQANLDPVALKKDWMTALEAGAGSAGLHFHLQEEDVQFAYYGNTLEDLVARRKTIADVLTKGKTPDLSAEALAWQASILDDLRSKAGISDDVVASFVNDEAVEMGVLNWPWVRATLQAIDKHVIFGSSASIYLFTHDVYHYLTNPGAIQLIETGVVRSIDPEIPTVVVGHSLGSIVAYNLLRNRSESLEVPLFVTLGSPLAVKAIKMALAPIKHPSGVANWFNAMDPLDIVSLYPLDIQHFPVEPPVENRMVENGSGDKHGIKEYLRDPGVAMRILNALHSN